VEVTTKSIINHESLVEDSVSARKLATRSTHKRA
jgi:hypothetical protein